MVHCLKFDSTLQQEMQQQDRRDALVDSQVSDTRDIGSWSRQCKDLVRPWGDIWAKAMQQVNGYNQQGADFQQRQMEEAGPIFVCGFGLEFEMM